MGNHQVEAWEGEGVSRNASEPIGASLLQVGSGQPSLERLRYNLHRRSQRRYRVPQGRTFYAHLVHDLGLRLL